jgi:general secretion pathway protein K
MRRYPKRGFALVAVLWILTSVAAIGALLTTSARESVATAQNRVDLLRAAWRARGCAEVARSVIDDALAANNAAIGTTAVWTRLGAYVLQSPLVSGCRLELRPSGTTIDVNALDSTRIRAVLLASGQTPDVADSLVDALLDWRDADQTARVRGAEEAWYAAEHRPGPRDGPFESPDELALVRGFDRMAGLDTLFGVENERIYVEAASLPVLASLPGMDGEALALVAESRMEGRPIRDLASLAGALPPSSRENLIAHNPELLRLTTPIPDAWIVMSQASVGTPPLEARIELRLVKVGSRAAIVRQRTWP